MRPERDHPRESSGRCAYSENRDEDHSQRCRARWRGADADDHVQDLRRSRLFGQLPGKNKLKVSSRLLVSPFPEIKIIPCCCGVLSLARSGGDRRSRLSTNSQHLLGMASGGQCRHCRRLTEVGLVRCAPAERLMRTSQIIPVEELGKAALLFDAAGGWAEIDP